MSPSTKDASREFGEGSAESKGSSEGRGWEGRRGNLGVGLEKEVRFSDGVQENEGLYTDLWDCLSTCAVAERFRTALRNMWLLLWIQRDGS